MEPVFDRQQVQDNDRTPANGTSVLLSSNTYPATYQSKVTRSVIISDASSIGSLAFSLPLDITVDAAARELGRRYTFFRITKVAIDMQSSSPMGTASGGLQAAHMPDPYNYSITPNPSLNVRKFVRQSGSSFIRPRNDSDFIVLPKNQRYTMQAGDLRHYSYGNIGFLVRAKPSTGDTAQWQVTVVMDFEFSVPAFASTGALTRNRIDFAHVLVNRTLQLVSKYPIPSNDLNLKFVRPLSLMYKDNDVTKREVVHHAVAHRIDVDKFSVDFVNLLPRDATILYDTLKYPRSSEIDIEYLAVS